MNASTQDIRASGLAERLTAILQDKAYNRQLTRQVRLAVGALLVGTIGTLLSGSLLLRTQLSEQAGQFWFLCLILSAGLFCVATLTLASSWTTHFAMQRFALGNKDAEVFEATREKEELRVRIEALMSLIEEASTIDRQIDHELLEQSLKFISRGDFLENTEYTAIWNTIAAGWKAKGVSAEKLSTLKTPHGVLA